MVREVNKQQPNTFLDCSVLLPFQVFFLCYSLTSPLNLNDASVVLFSGSSYNKPHVTVNPVIIKGRSSTIVPTLIVVNPLRCQKN